MTDSVAMLPEPVSSCESDIFFPESRISYKAGVFCVYLFGW